MTQHAPHRPPALLPGVPIDDVNMDEAVAHVADLVTNGRRHHRTHQVATVNVDFLVNALDDESTRRLLQGADLSLADGMPVLWGARAAGMSLRERVTGADLVPALAARAAENSWHIHLFGSSPGTAEAAAELLRTRHPGARITGCSGPVIRDVSAVDDDVLTDIIELDPDILCVALGNPKQERFIDANRARLRTPVMIGVGGTFDMLIGNKKRAPSVIQKIGMEWVVRLAQEPGRLAKRYGHDALVFFPSLARYLRKLRRPSGATLVIRTVDGAVVLNAGPARPAGADNSAAWGEAVTALRNGSTLVLDLGGSPPLEAEAVSELVGLLRLARREGSVTEVRQVDRRLIEQMSSLDLQFYLEDAATHL